MLLYIDLLDFSINYYTHNVLSLFKNTKYITTVIHSRYYLFQTIITMILNLFSSQSFIIPLRINQIQHNLKSLEN
jgi:hypothetical protein